MHRLMLTSALAAIGTGVILGATAFRSDIAQATGLAQAVTVTNTAAQPVPVREQNLDGGNIKVHEQGTVKVTVQNRPTHTPHVVEMVCGFVENGPCAGTATVPAGQRFVIETVSGYTNRLVDEFVVVVGDLASNLNTDYWFSGSHVNRDGQTHTIIDTHAVSLYADPGTTIYASAFPPTLLSPSGGYGSFTLSGYLVPAP
jgi:hypothetical protein